MSLPMGGVPPESRERVRPGPHHPTPGRRWIARRACPSPKPHPTQLTTADALATGEVTLGDSRQEGLHPAASAEEPISETGAPTARRISRSVTPSSVVDPLPRT